MKLKKNINTSKERRSQIKNEEEEGMRILKGAKTGDTIIIPNSYGVIIDGKDTGKRFIRKKDAEEYLKRLKKHC